MSQFAKTLHQSYTSQIICLSSHLICAFMLIFYVYQNRNKTPIIQNSPILTICAQVMLVVASVCLLISKIVYKIQGHPNDSVDGKGCYGLEENKTMIALNVVYIFCVEFMYMSYFYKMMRIIWIYFRHKCLKIIKTFLKNQYILVFLAAMWASFIITCDLLMKYNFHSQLNNDNRHLRLYPQFNQFLCDKNLQQPYSQYANIIYKTKLAFSLSLFLIAWCLSYLPQRIDQDLKLRKQYFVLLSLPFSVMLTGQILKLIYSIKQQQINISLPVHYVDCLSNLTTGIFLLIIHFDSVKKDKQFYLPDIDDLDGHQASMPYLFSRQQSRIALHKYFIHMDKQKLFLIQAKLLNPSFNHLQIDVQVLNEIKQCLSAQNNKILDNSLNKQIQFDRAKDMLQKQIMIMIKEWKLSVSGMYLQHKWKKNAEYYQNMRELNLVAVGRVGSGIEGGIGSGIGGGIGGGYQNSQGYTKMNSQ